MYSSFLKYTIFIIIYVIIAFIMLSIENCFFLGILMLIAIFPIAIIMRIKLKLEKEKFEKEKAENLRKIAENTKSTDK